MASALVVFGYDDAGNLYGEYLRWHEIRVYDATAPELALAAVDGGTVPDVVVCGVRFANSSLDAVSFVQQLRGRVDDATSIIVIAGLMREEDRETFRTAGADMFLLTPALPSAVLYEVKRALLLRRSGRRLSWNWPKSTAKVEPAAVDRRRNDANR
jgi:DNA-binding response OmpR family regulator